MRVRPQTRPPPNGTQAHDMSRELWFNRLAHVGATPFGDGLVCWSLATAGVSTSPREHVAFGSEKEAAGEQEKLDQIGHPRKSPCRASLRSDNCPIIPDQCPTISDFVSDFIGMRSSPQPLETPQVARACRTDLGA
jgi:hypothetical protein